MKCMEECLEENVKEKKKVRSCTLGVGMIQLLSVPNYLILHTSCSDVDSVVI